MPISFNEIPALRLPGIYVEFDNRLAGNAAIDFKLLVFGQRLVAGTVAAGVPTRINSNESLIEEYFGRGSMLAEMCKAIKRAQPWLETWAIALDDAVAGVAAAGSITLTGTATEAGTLVLYVGGKAVKAAVAAADTQTAMAAALAAAINADTTLPVTATVDGVNQNQVNVTCRWKGETGNDIDLRFNYYGEKTPKGVTTAITAMTGGTTNPDIATAIAAMGDTWYNWIVMPYTDTANLVALETELNTRWGPMRQIGARAFTAYRGTHSATGTFGASRNNPHMSCMGTNTTPTPPYLFAAINAVVAGYALAIDPARQLRGLALPGVLAPAIADRWDDTERNELLYDGIATYTVATDGTVRIERQITMYQTNAAGIADDSYLDITTPETLERYRFKQRAMFAQKYPRHKLAKDTERVPPGQAIMQPKLARMELLALYKEMQDLGWVQDYDAYAETLVVEIDSQDNNRLNIYDSPVLVRNLIVTAVHVEFR